MTDWAAYTHYQCRRCSEMCINRSEETSSSLDLCRGCLDELHGEVFEHLSVDVPPADTSARPSGGRAWDDRREDPSQRDSPEPTGSPERGRGAVVSDQSLPSQDTRF